MGEVEMYTNIKKNAGMLFGTILLGGGNFPDL